MKRSRRWPQSLIRKAALRKKYSLAKLLLKIPEGDPIVDEWDTMPLVGNEIEAPLTTLRSIRAMRRFLRKLKRNRHGRKATARLTFPAARNQSKIMLPK